MDQNQRFVKVLLGGKEHNVLTRVDGNTEEHGDAKRERSGGIFLACDGQTMTMTMRTGHSCLMMQPHSITPIISFDSSKTRAATVIPT